ncbi:hypothetical protein T310_9899, partial [Rasamsonia emersonii CBS 393.64]
HLYRLGNGIVDDMGSAPDWFGIDCMDSHIPSEDDILLIFNGQTGGRLLDVPAPLSYRLQRQKFLKLIATGVEIQVGYTTLSPCTPIAAHV